MIKLLEQILKIPTRRRPIRGRTYEYVRLEYVIHVIKAELLRHVEPVAWGIFTVSTNEMVGFSTAENQFLCNGMQKMRPLFTNTTAKPVLLSADDVWDAYVRSTLQVMNSEQEDIHSFAEEVEQAVLKANGLGGVE